MPPTSIYQSPGLVFGDSAERTSPKSKVEGSSYATSESREEETLEPNLPRGQAQVQELLLTDNVV